MVTYHLKQVTLAVLGCLSLSACMSPTSTVTENVTPPTKSTVAQATQPVVTAETAKISKTVPIINNDDAPVLKTEEEDTLVNRDPAEDEKGAQKAITALLNQNCKASDCKAPKKEIPVKVLFKVGSAQLASHNPRLEAFAKQLKVSGKNIFSDRRLQINGHTDSTGNPEANRRLSEQRAESVKNFLVNKHGIDPNHLVVKGHGADKLLAAPDNTPETRAQNRRVGFKTVYENEK